MRVGKAAGRQAGVVTAALCLCCVPLGAWGAPDASASESGARWENARTASPESVPQCYATRGAPQEIVCYRRSWKAEFRHGDVVYVPRLIQVPRPAHPSSVVIVDRLDDIRPGGT
ncbi:hypothetical protein EV284_5102 [Streptomyces sp. BK022]|uniref:hypothetical protein n=1 Tax=Streptomyces sp. BK022 TaxID=2512123 RepID=UPI001029BFC4|nr:hypothetical protein [Streptomyces sp. BK022]RZU30145.1 hypothetical protein EV284_5102 [Streptomyces sp. BK022]